MLGMLRNPPEPFEDVIRTHFKLKAKSLMAQLDEWLELDDGHRTFGDGAGHGIPSAISQVDLNPSASSSNSLQKNVNELKIELRKLLGEDVSYADLDESSGVDLQDTELPADELPADELDDVELNISEMNGVELNGAAEPAIAV